VRTRSHLSEAPGMTPLRTFGLILVVFVLLAIVLQLLISAP
jgi:hypothetical protein